MSCKSKQEKEGGIKTTGNMVRYRYGNLMQSIPKSYENHEETLLCKHL